MRRLVRIAIAGLLGAGLAGVGAVLLPRGTGFVKRWSRSAETARTGATGEAGAMIAGLPAETSASSAVPFSDQDMIEDGGFGIAAEFTGPIRDTKSLRALRSAIEGRGRSAVTTLGVEIDLHLVGPQSDKQTLQYASQLQKNLGLAYMYQGQFTEARTSFQRAMTMGEAAAAPPYLRAELKALLGITALRRGEADNGSASVGRSSSIFPMDREAAHQKQDGSREAIKELTEYLDSWPHDKRIQWLLNIAYMTVGEYPEGVPRRYLIPLDTFQSKLDVGRFDDVALRVGLTARGPGLAGGSVFDDFTGDGLPDLLTTSLDADRGAALYVNLGDGAFEDRSAAAGLDDQIYARNVTRADFDNDGNLDVLLLRGGGEKPMRLSLLRNTGDGIFQDVTIKSGMDEPIASESAAWGDYDNDGLVDVFVCGEYLPQSGGISAIPPDSRNHSRLYHNQGDGTFKDVAAAAGVVNDQCAKGCAWGDYDGDGRIDLYVSNMYGPSRLYRNEGDGVFRDVAPSLGVTGADVSSACWFWDYDNDGNLDIYVSERGTSLADTVAIALGKPVETRHRPRLYRNLGTQGFREVTREVGLDKAIATMGCNFGDIDNDGYLDMYLGAGWMSFSGLVPNRMLKNVSGHRFEDITLSSGTGRLQKGHGVSFADWDGDGDLDVFVVCGGAVPGDKAFNALFQNPGHTRHWLKVKLVGMKTNRAALGARIRAVVKATDGSARSIYRTVGNNSSSGGNSLVELIGLLDSTGVAELEVSWPTSGLTQIFREVKADQVIEIIEGSDTIKVVRKSKMANPRP
jgi:tetratricopeptide (TPR) repeat protein